MENDKVEKVKKHINDNKYRYGCAILGGVVIGLLLRKSNPSQVINTIAPVFNNANTATLGGHLRKIVYCVELDRYFTSVTEAAEFAKVSISNMSRHLNEHTDQINQLHYKIVGVAN